MIMVIIIMKKKMMMMLMMMMMMMRAYPCQVPQASPSPQMEGRNIDTYTLGDSGLGYVPGVYMLYMLEKS